MRQSMLTGISRIARASPRVACPALLLVGCLLIAAVVTLIRFRRLESGIQKSAEGPLAAEPRARGKSKVRNRRTQPRFFIWTNSSGGASRST